MKTIKYISILVFAAVIGVSCTLERENYDEIYVENFYKSENDLKLATTALYHPFNTNWLSDDEGVFCSNNQGYQIFTEMTTDALRCTWGWEWDELWLHKWYAAKSGGEMNIFYKAFARYNLISSARNVTRDIENSTLEESVKRPYIAEAKAVRAWMGLYLYDLFGPVPVAPDSVLDDPETIVYLPRLTEEQYTEFMEGELKYAIEFLPEYASERGRLTKGAARMMLLKFYMIRRDFEKALPIARDLYNMEAQGIYTMLDYEYVFSKDGVGNKEIILQIPCNVDDMPNYWVAHAVPTNYPWPAPQAANWGAFRIPWDFYDTFDPADKRLKGIIAEYTAKDGTSVTRGNGELTLGAIPAKYGVDPGQVGSGTAIDVIVYRFSDALLSLAECINETNGSPTQEAIDLVDRVRDRAGLGGLSAAETAGKDAFNEAVLKERGHEFYAEGLRRQDLIRHGKYISSAQERSGNQTASYKTRFPIPVWFITESNEEIKQNTGY